MKIDGENLDSLRSLIRKLEHENKTLKNKLDKANIPYENHDLFNDEMTASLDFDIDQGERINTRYINDDLANRFFAMFWGRTDVYAKRGKNGGYFPQCDNRWKDLCPKQHGEKIKCEDCINKKWSKLTLNKIVEHLLGYKDDCSDVIGIYPLLKDMTCRFIVFDFDNHNDESDVDEWKAEINALHLICKKNNISHLTERSRSGKGGHLWIFFKNPIPASLARNFGLLLLEKGQMEINLKSFKYYDRLYPCQDFTDGIGNLIALPLQGRALKNGNSAFVDDNFNAYSDQWDILLNKTSKLSIEDVKKYIMEWNLASNQNTSLFPEYQEDRMKPWKKEQRFSRFDVVDKLHIVLCDGIYVDTLNLMPRIQNQIRSLAVFDNPIFYKNKRMGYSNYNNFSIIYMGKDVGGYIRLPRGLKETLIEKCKEANIEYDIDDQREKGRPIRVSFKGDLRVNQDLAANKMLENDHGILNATTGFGKTVVSSYLIAKRRVNTLILVQNKSLLDQWVNELNKFLAIDEPMPTYKTKSGKTKKRNGLIGVLSGNKNTLTGIIDVAMIGSMNNKDIDNTYGLVIMDECHHCGSATSIEVMNKIKARYVYGVSATVMRSDKLDKIIFFLLGPIRHSYTSKENISEQGIGHYVYPVFTRVVYTNDEDKDINSSYKLISNNKARNELIIDDTRDAIKNGRTVLILTKYKEQAKSLYDELLNDADYVFLLYGDNADKDNTNILNGLKDIPNDKSVIIIATGQKIGEGFDFPRLDTLMLACPVSFGGRLEQYVGRINRECEKKKDAIVYDYVDSHLKVFENMYLKRLKTYKRLGYRLISNVALEKQKANAIYDSSNYYDVFENDLIEANKRIIISSPYISEDKIDRFIYVTASKIDAKCKITIITLNPDGVLFDNGGDFYRMLKKLNEVGIEVIVKDELYEHFAIIDDDLCWHGGMNLLGKEDIYDNLMRIKSAKIAEELLEMCLTK